MKNINRYLLTAAIVLSAADGTASAGNVSGDISIVSPEATHDSKNLSVSFTIMLDDLEIPSGDAVIFTPLYIGTDTVTMPSTVAAGRKEIIYAGRTNSYEGLEVVRRRNGTKQQIDYTASVPWESWMETGRLILREDRCGCGLTSDGPEHLLAEFDFSPLPEPQIIYMRPVVEITKTREAHGSAFLDFPVNKTTILPGYRNNSTELKKIVTTIDTIANDPNIEINAIEIHGFASPEGSYANNKRLAEGRAFALRDYVRSIRDIPSSIFSVGSTPENWDGLRQMVGKSDIDNRDALLEIIDSDEDPDLKEARMRRTFPQAYAMIKENFYPSLRRSDYTVRYTIRPFTTEEVLEIVRINPSQVSHSELFAAAATFPDDSDEFNELMAIAVHLFPSDPIANLNAAANALRHKNLDAAGRFLEKAGDSPEARHARGIAAYLNGNLDEALRLLENSGIAPENNLNMVRKAIERSKK